MELPSVLRCQSVPDVSWSSMQVWGELWALSLSTMLLDVCGWPRVSAQHSPPRELLSILHAKSYFRILFLFFGLCYCNGLLIIQNFPSLSFPSVNWFARSVFQKHGFIFISPSIYPFVQQVFIECQLCVKHPFRYWGYNNEEFRQLLHPQGVYNVGEADNKQANFRWC